MRKTKRITSLLLALCMLMAFMPNSMVSAASTFSGGTGTEDDPYILSTAQDFIDLATEVNNGTSYANTFFKVADSVTEPIELTTADGFKPIGKYVGADPIPFEGTFDGNNKTIKLDINESINNVGLFGYTASAVIKNVKTTGSVGGELYVGGIAGNMNFITSKIINCHNSATVTGYGYTGGIVGMASGVSVVNCSNSGTVEGEVGCIGGIVGEATSRTPITNCLNTGSVTGAKLTGGIVGNPWVASLANCVNDGTVKKREGSQHEVGGIAGCMGMNINSLTMTNCYYNSDKNEGLYDIAYEDYALTTLLKTTECSASGEEIISDVIDIMNVYASKNSADGIALSYWKVTGDEGSEVISFTDEEPTDLPYMITNNLSNYIKVKKVAELNEVVEITLKELSYETIKDVTVTDTNGNKIPLTETLTGYTFTMPESDVTVSANVDLNLNRIGDGVYEIASKEDMIFLSNAVKAGYNTKEKSFILTENITLKTTDGFNPIGTVVNPFYGMFDGQNHTVTLDIEVEVEDNTALAGIFGVVEKNGPIEDKYGMVKNVRTAGKVKSTGNKGYAGAIFAKRNDGNFVVDNCHNTADITASDYAGGIAGGAVYAHLYNCSNSGTVTINNTNYVAAGGIAGECTYVHNCYNSGSIIGEVSGGIAGTSWDGDILNCVNSGTVTNGGAIIGTEESGIGMISYNCYVSGTADAGIKTGPYGEALADEDTGTKAVDEQTLFTEDGLAETNWYVKENNNGLNNEIWLYWKVTDGVISFTETAPVLPNIITNKSSTYITVSEKAKSGETVEITVNDITYKDVSYATVTGVTVTDTNKNEVSLTETETGYTFTMPESDVTVLADIDINLKKVDGVYQISSAEDMEVLSYAVIKDIDTTGKNFKVVAEDTIVLNGIKIGSVAYSFNGIFDGNGKTFDISVERDSDMEANGGVFYSIGDGAVIKNVKTTGTAISRCMGGIVGIAYEGSTVINCYNDADIISEIIGAGIVYGVENGATVKNCVNSGTISTGGGVVGAILNTANLENNYYATGTADFGVFMIDGVAVEADDDTQTKAVDEITEDVIEDVNVYVRDNTTEEESCLYWTLTGEGENKTVEFTSEPVKLPYSIINESEYITVPEKAKPGETVEITVNQPEDDELIERITNVIISSSDEYEEFTSISISENDEDNKYSFEMPESPVKIVLKYEYKKPETDENGTYLISSAKDLYLFSLTVNNGEDSIDAKVTAEEIDATEYDIEIGDGNYSYSGTFDGNGATIITEDAIFDYTSSATIKNINAVVKNAERAGIVNYSYGSTLIDNCNVDISFENVDGIGGIAFSTYESTVITNCSVTAHGTAEYFGGIVGDTYNDTIIVNCIMNESDIEAYFYGGIVYCANGDTKVINCVNADIVNVIGNEGGIICIASDDVITENNFYISDDEKNINVYDICYDTQGNMIYTITDPYSAVSYDDYLRLYIPAMMNRYIEENPEIVSDVQLNKWSVYYDESEEPVMCTADEENEEVYYVEYTEITVDGAQCGALAGDKVTVSAPDGAKIVVTDKDGTEIEVSDGVFTMPHSNVNVEITMDSGIEETKEIDGKTYVVVKTGEDLVKAVKSIDSGNNVLNIFIAEDIVLSEDDMAAYPSFREDAPEYNGIFDGNGKTITLDNKYLINVLGKDGVIKNLTLDGVTNMYSVFVFENRGTIINCINNTDVTNNESGATVFAVNNRGIIINCINNGTISSDYLPCTAVCLNNTNKVLMCASSTEITYEGAVHSEFVMNNYGSVNGCMMIEDSAENLAADMNYIFESIKFKKLSEDEDDFKEMLEEEYGLTEEDMNQLKLWSAVGEDTLVFADEENKPYYRFITPDGAEAYCAGETVTFTIDTSDFEEDLVLDNVLVCDMENNEISITQVADEENTYTFTMPDRTCMVKINAVPGSLETETGADGREYYLIDNIDDFKTFARTVNAGNTYINAKLTADIEDEYTGDEIGSEYNPYMGVFDGNGHSINLNMSDEYEVYYGLFGVLGTKAIVKNLTTKGTVGMDSEEGISTYMGAVAGLNQGTITGCTNEVEIFSTSYAAGIAGKSVSVISLNMDFAELFSADEEVSGTGIIKDCVNNADISGKYAAGIAGRIENGNDGLLMGDNTVTITGCVNNGDIVGYSLGGIVARAYGIEGNRVVIENCVNNGSVEGDYECGGIAKETKYALVDNCVNNGDVSAHGGEDFYGENVGGIVGDSDIDAVIKNCVNNGDVYAGTYDAGGIMGDGEDGTQIINCINNGNVGSPEYVGGIIGTCSEDLMIINCYNSGNVSGDDVIYAIASHEDYYEDSEPEEMSKVIIKDTYYLQAEFVNADLESSNFHEESDSSVAVATETVISGEVSYKLNAGINDNSMNKWSVNDSGILFADEDNGAVYMVTIDEKIENGTVKADRKYFRAGETVTVTAKASDGYALKEITGVELDENNTFVMPEEDVTISAVFVVNKACIEATDGNDGKYTIRYLVPEGVDYTLIIAKYNDDGSVKSIEVIASADDTNNGELVVDSSENVKIMLWSDLSAMIPLCQSYEVK